MTRRIVYWALAGFVVAWGWVMYGAGPGFGQNFGHWMITEITAPASFVGWHLHMPLTWYQFMVLNAALYAAVGLVLEPVMRVVAGRHRAA